MRISTGARTRRGLACLGAAVAAAWATTAAFGAWSLYTAAGDGFSAEFPGEPMVTARQDDITLLSDTYYTVSDETSLAVVQAAHFFMAPGGEEAALDLFKGVLRAAEIGRAHV